jgi:phage N-6-adenine-methyltransferase
VSIAGFKSQNHPQQTKKRGAVDAVDDRGTDRAFFEATSERFGGFNLDVAASHRNAKCARYYTLEDGDDGLDLPWLGRVWCNPPYSDLRAWVAKAWDAWGGSPRIGQPEVIVMLVPANRTEQGWWQDLVEPWRDGREPESPLRVEFLRGRMRFDRPNAVIGPKGDRPPFGCCLLIWTAPEGDHAAHTAGEGGGGRG